MMSRRQFLRATAAGITAGSVRGKGEPEAANPSLRSTKREKTAVSLIKTSDRATGIKRTIDLLGINPAKGRDVLLKPNFNTADPFPGSTHNDTLEVLIIHLQSMGGRSITIGERSGPP